MDYEKRAKRQSLRVIISESIMVLTVIVLVAVLAFVVSGYWVNSDFKVERQGMLQISSVPTGANVSVDGTSPWFQRTNTSKVLSSGEHHVVLTKDGYDSWSKTVTIGEGLLYRLHYPRLFLNNRTKSTVYDVAGAKFASVSRDHKQMLIVGDSCEWTLLDLTNDTPTPKTLDIPKYFTCTVVPDESGTPNNDTTDAATQSFAGTITSTQWSGDNAHILISASVAGATEWVLLDIRDIKNSINLTREFAADFTDMRIFDHSASNLLAVRAGNLHKINVSSRQVSAVLVEGVYHYDSYGQDIIYVNATTLGILKGASDQEVLTTFTAASSGEADGSSVMPAPAITASNTSRAYISRFYEDKYITIVTGDTITVYNYDSKERVYESTISFVPEQIYLGIYGDYVFMRSGTTAATLDMESRTIAYWSLACGNPAWLESNLFYCVDSGVLSVYDYDGLNHRSLATSVANDFPVTITDNKWLYYFSDNSLVREIIVQ
ncbi:PEGA domain-containing protein [Candidatus Saccharibacteria bacterium]|nr:PEGA domain-containing protein [Candidatus Saccharibacteria bacterium]